MFSNDVSFEKRACASVIISILADSARSISEDASLTQRESRRLRSIASESSKLGPEAMGNAVPIGGIRTTVAQ